MALLDVEQLKTHFFTAEGVLPAVDGVSFGVARGEVVGIVGESGCGKSVTAMSVLRLVQPPGRIVSGAIRYAGRDILGMTNRELRRLRGNAIAMIFQEPMTSLNPVYTIGAQISEGIMWHRGYDPQRAWAAAVRMIDAVGIPAPDVRARAYPHQMSGGMKQRVMIAMALSCDPDVLIADEPTTALDVTIQAQVLALLTQQQRKRGMAIVLITHDLAVVAETCQRVIVMYAGQVVEGARTRDLFAQPAHPYTLGLLRSLPDRAIPGTRLPVIAGNVPSPLDFPSGCRFRDRCPRATTRCAQPPPRQAAGHGHDVWCHHPHGMPAPGERDG